MEIKNNEEDKMWSIFLKSLFYRSFDGSFHLISQIKWMIFGILFRIGIYNK